MSIKAKYDALIEEGADRGQTVDSFGKYNEATAEGCRVRLVRNEDMWFVVKDVDEEKWVGMSFDEEESREEFDDIKKEMEAGAKNKKDKK